jgi:hypothetical protein
MNHRLTEPTLSSYAARVSDHGCLGGSAAGGALPTELVSSVLSATKSLYRLSTVQVRVGVETVWGQLSSPTKNGRGAHFGRYT